MPLFYLPFKIIGQMPMKKFKHMEKLKELYSEHLSTPHLASVIVNIVLYLFYDTSIYLFDHLSLSLNIVSQNSF